jgi:hypothetical protein
MVLDLRRRWTRKDFFCWWVRRARLDRCWVRDLGLLAVGTVGAARGRVVCGARRGRCCCGGRCRSCELGLWFVYVSCVLSSHAIFLEVYFAP